MPTYIYAPPDPLTNIQTVEGTPFTPPGSVTLAESWPADMVPHFVDITALEHVPPPGSTYSGGGFTAPPAPTPSNAQAAASLQAGGLTITSTSTPALNAVYALDQTTIGLITAEQLYALTNGSFSNGSGSLLWLYSSPPVTFPNVASFKAVSSAIAQTMTALTDYGAGLSAAPSMSVTIP